MSAKWNPVIESAITLPLTWRRPRRIFVNSMSDLFHESIPIAAQERVFRVMFSAPHHVYQVLTKRSGLMRERIPIIMNRIFGYHWAMPDFIHLGVSVENQATADARIPDLLDTPAAKRFVSYEPALGPVDFQNLHGVGFDALYGACTPRRRINQIIVGGESGPDARPFDVRWARDTIRQCREAGVACFVKQFGAKPYDSNCPPLRLKDRKGGDMSEWPEELRVRELV